MRQKPDLTLVGGTEATRPEYQNPNASSGRLVETRFFDEHGNRLRIPIPGEHDGAGGGDGSMKMTLPDLRWNVAILNALAALFTVALVGMFLWMVDRIDDKFEEADKRVSALSDKVSDLRVEIAGQRADIRAVLEKLDGNAQASPRNGEPR